MSMLGAPRVSLSLALSGLTAPSSLREQIEFASALGFQAVQLNAAATDARPRDLGRSARRDVAAIIRRSELAVSGVDLWIPPAHFLDPQRADHAIAAACDAIEFAAEISALVAGSSRATLALTLPEDRSASSGAVRTLTDRCLNVGTKLADFTRPACVATSLDSPLGTGIDPAAIMLESASPDVELLRLGARVVEARLSDIGPRAAGRVAPGDGRLDVTAYLVAASTLPRLAPLTLDLQGVQNQPRAARETVRRWGMNPGGE